MPWTTLVSPLDQTIESLEWLIFQMRNELASGIEIRPANYQRVAGALEQIVHELKPLQETRLEERRTT
ncbi:hypothetical protein BH09CHL1_BH09CHL1_21570 [soil metagenome]